MTLDKIIKVMNNEIANGAESSNFVQGAETIMDNTSGVIPKTIRTIFVNASLFPKASHKQYYAMLFITERDNAVPNFAGDLANLNVMLDRYRDNIWTTQNGIAKYAANGLVDEALVPFEPSTGRKLMPGQKLVWILLCKNIDNTTAGNTVYTVDVNIWFDM